ncbi:acyl carrier protein [Cyanobacteria bacterium FACHB-63]|nr:acyl carrier protein [Cyanobacteria bacterium FACHB-63]
MQNVKDIIRKYISETILFSQSYPYADEDSLLENGIIDSMNVMELVVFLEENMNIQVEDHEISPDNFDSVNGLAAYVQRKQLLAV